MSQSFSSYAELVSYPYDNTVTLSVLFFDDQAPSLLPALSAQGVSLLGGVGGWGDLT